MTDQPRNGDAGEAMASKLFGIGFVLIAVYFLFRLVLNWSLSRLLNNSGSDLETAMTLALYGIPVLFALVAGFGMAAAISLLWRRAKRSQTIPDNAVPSQTPFSRGMTLALVIIIIVAILLFAVLLISVYYLLKL